MLGNTPKLAPRFYTAFIPYVIILITLTLSYSFLNWMIFIKSKTFVAYPSVLYLLIPIILSALSVIYWLRPRLRRLTFVFDHDKSFRSFQIIAIVLLCTVIYYAQILLEDRLTKVVKLHDIAELYDQKASKFFSAENYTVKKNLFGYYFSLVKHKHKGRLSYTMDLFFAFPVFSKSQQSPVVWVGIQFHESTSDSFDREQLDVDKDKFIAKAFKKIQKMQVEKFYYLELMRDDSISAGFEHAVSNSPVKLSDTYLVLRGGYKPLEDKLAEDLANFIVTLSISLMIWGILLALLATDESKKSAVDQIESD